MKIEPTSKALPGFFSLPGSGEEITAGDEQAAYVWLVCVPRLIHPLKLTIIEVLLYMEQPLSATQLVELLDQEDCYLGLISYHLGTLKEAQVIELVESRSVRGAKEHFYYFPGLAPASRSADLPPLAVEADQHGDDPERAA
jgi:hypothetical protein